jgi:MraZ protein
MADDELVDSGDSGGGIGVLDAHLPTRFKGRADYSIDDKGRLTLPPQLRKPLLDGGNLSVIDGVAVIWDELTFRAAVDSLEEAVRQADLDKKQLRLFLSQIVVVQPDTQGRIVVPDRIRAAAGLERDVVVCGVGSRIELWPAGRYELEVELEQDGTVAQFLDRKGF